MVVVQPSICVSCSGYVHMCTFAVILVFYIYAIEQLSQHRAEVVVSLVLDNIVHFKTGVY